MIISKCQNILDFFINSGEPYVSMDQKVLQENVVHGVVTGQYLWEPGRYAVLYWLVNPWDMQTIIDRHRPSDISYGSVLYVVECACKEGMEEIRKRLHAIPWEGAFWKSHKSGKHRIFARCKGARI